jgi:hypothetical protein
MRLLNTPEDMAWLREVHLPHLPAIFLSAIIEGNEDSPERIDCYLIADPSLNDKPVTYWLTGEDYFPFYD